MATNPIESDRLEGIVNLDRVCDPDPGEQGGERYLPWHLKSIADQTGDPSISRLVAESAKHVAAAVDVDHRARQRVRARRAKVGDGPGDVLGLGELSRGDPRCELDVVFSRHVRVR